MRQWLTLIKKELLEMWRNFKWIWLPIVFAVLGMSDPLTTYYMPKILDAVGGLPEGAVIEMPVPSANEVLLMVINQLSLLGVLIIVLASMGIIASERKSGLAAMILVKPIPIYKYVTAKLVSLYFIGFVSLLFGYLSGWYYTIILFGGIDFSYVVKGFLLLFMWFAFILTLTLFFSSLFKVPGITGFITLATIIVLSILTNTLGRYMTWSPAQLTDSIGSIVMTGQLGEHFWLSFAVTILLTVAFLLSSVMVLKNKEFE